MIRLQTLILEGKYGTDPKFERLGEGQRGAPEEAMVKVQESQISQLYNSAVEHVGDLTNRMCQVSLLQWSYGATKEKTDKTLRWISNPYGFRKEIDEQIENNFRYYHEKGNSAPWWVSVPNATAHLQQLSKKYADAHRALPTFNRVTKLGQFAAVSLGEWRFDDTVAALRQLKSVLDSGLASWAKAITENTNEKLEV